MTQWWNWHGEDEDAVEPPEESSGASDGGFWFELFFFGLLIFCFLYAWWNTQ